MFHHIVFFPGHVLAVRPGTDAAGNVHSSFTANNNVSFMGITVIYHCICLGLLDCECLLSWINTFKDTEVIHTQPWYVFYSNKQLYYLFYNMQHNKIGPTLVSTEDQTPLKVMNSPPLQSKPPQLQHVMTPNEGWSALEAAAMCVSAFSLSPSLPVAYFILTF